MPFGRVQLNSRHNYELVIDENLCLNSNEIPLYGNHNNINKLF